MSWDRSAHTAETNAVILRCRGQRWLRSERPSQQVTAPDRIARKCFGSLKSFHCSKPSWWWLILFALCSDLPKCSRLAAAILFASGIAKTNALLSGARNGHVSDNIQGTFWCYSWQHIICRKTQNRGWAEQCGLTGIFFLGVNRRIWGAQTPAPFPEFTFSAVFHPAEFPKAARRITVAAKSDPNAQKLPSRSAAKTQAQAPDISRLAAVTAFWMQYRVKP